MFSKRLIRRTLNEHANIRSIQRREFWPLIVAGVAIAAGSTVIHYTVRAIQRMKAEQENPIDESPSSEEKTKTSIKVEYALGLDIGSSNSRISLKVREESPKIIENSQGLRYFFYLFSLPIIA